MTTSMKMLLRLFIAPVLAVLPLTPAFCELHIHPHASVIQEYDSNLTYRPDNEISDTDTRVQVGLSGEYAGKLDSVKLTSYLFHRYYNKHSEFDATSGVVDFEIEHEFSRFDSILLSDRYHHGNEPQAFADIFGRTTTGFYTFSSNDFTAEYTRQFSSQLNGILRYGNSFTTYSETTTSDTTESWYGAGLEYAFTSRDYALANYRYSRLEYRPGGVIRSNTVNGGIRHYFSTTLNIEALAGYQFLKNINDTDSNDPVYQVSITDSITDKLDGKLTYLWENSTSSYSTELFKQRRISFDLTDRVTRRLKIDASMFYGEGEYEQSRVTQDLAGARFGLLYEVLEHINLTASVGYTKQTSNDPGSEYKRVTASAGIRIEW